ncbi:amidohydrolase family protein [Glutamicibacter sp. NPDC087344]|uniref:amidohydrolase family protein n=1 Tax=Glutamicibacter sp. NPDC087344 TaxID=3363994 RepID=UPI00380617E5
MTSQYLDVDPANAELGQMSLTPQELHNVYRGAVVDAHHHLWDLATGDYPWLGPHGNFGPPGRFDPLKGRNYSHDDYRKDVTGAGVVGSVHVEAMWNPESGQERETQWLDGLAHEDSVALRYVAGVPFGHRLTRSTLEKHLDSERVVGVRQTIGWTPDPNLQMASESNLTETVEWRKSVELVLDRGLLLELLMYPEQALNVANLARTYPELQIVINHKGSPADLSGPGRKRWRDGLERMAQHTNIAIKLSASFSFLNAKTQSHLDEQVGVLAETFGPERMVFGSDFPVASLQGFTYAQTLEAVRRSTRSLELSQQTAIFLENAIRIYQLDPSELREI